MPDLIKTIACPFTVIIDTAEQLPYTFRNMRANADQKHALIRVPTIRKSLKTGDYGIQNFHRFAIERKSKSDLFASIARRQNFLDRLIRFTDSYEFGAVVVEAELSEILGIKPYSIPQIIDILGSHHLASAGEISEFYASGSGKVARIISSFQSIPLHYQDPKPLRSQYDKKALLRTIQSWKIRYPRVHWEFLPGRAAAEAWTFRLMQAYHKQQTIGA